MASGGYPNHGPRTNLIANQEIRQAMRGDAPPAFGIRRMVDEDNCNEIIDVTFGMQESGDIPEAVVLRDSLAVTLLSQKVISRQLRRGLVAGYNLGRTGAMVERSDAFSDRYEPLDVERGEISFFKDRVIYAKVVSPEIECEIEGMGAILDSVGIKGHRKQRGPKVPHMTLGEVEKGYMLSRTEQRHIKHMLEDTLAETINVTEWDVYPDVFNNRRH